MIITIDGPTGSGKTSVAAALARKLHFCALSSGRFYRALAYVLLDKKHVAPIDFIHLTELQLNAAFAQISYHYNPAHANFDVYYEGALINDFLKNAAMDQAASLLSKHPGVRQLIDRIQHAVAQEWGNVVVEGRDTGTVVFPHAEIKIFLTASPEIRAQRWQQDQKNRGNDISLEEALKQINERDVRDSNRAIAPLKIPEDAFVEDNSAHTQEETVQRLLEYIRSRSY